MSVFKKLLLLLLVTTPAYAGQISLGTISADATVAGFNDNFTTIADVINGEISGSTDSGATVSNIKAASVFNINMGADASPSGRAAELLGNTVDTFSSGTLTQNTFVYSGCVPATDTDLTSDISACIAYVNGYRIVKGATSENYDASMDTYVDLSQTGVYTLTAVANGATQPTVAANSARIALVVTSGTAITSYTDMARRSLAGLVVPSNYRSGMVVSKDSTTTITVMPGTVEINSTMIPKTTPTTLTISTAGDWAGGSSLRAASTYGYVGMTSTGTIKLHTTAPTHTNYAVSSTVGKKRFATWSSTVYRILGWFYMDGAQLVENASNLKEGDVANIIISNDITTTSLSSTSLVEFQKANFYSSGGPIMLYATVSGDSAASLDQFVVEFERGGTAIIGSGSGYGETAGGKGVDVSPTYLDLNRPQGTTNYGLQGSVSASSMNLRKKSIIVNEA